MKKIKYAAQSDFRPGRGSCVPKQLRVPPIPERPEERTFRPCEVGGEEGCVFHRFVDEDRVILQLEHFMPLPDAVRMRRFMDEEGVIPAGERLEHVRVTWALVEYPDGTLRKVDPERVRFLDREG